MPRLSSRPISTPAFALILLLGIIAAILVGSRDSVQDDVSQISVGPPVFEHGMRAVYGKQVEQASSGSGETAISSADDPDGGTRIEKTEFSIPDRNLQINEPKLFLATAGKSSDTSMVSLTNSTEKVYAYTSSLDDQGAGFFVTVCSDGFVRPNSHCALNITYKPKVMGNSAARLSLRFVEVGGEGTETLTVLLSGYAMANCEMPGEASKLSGGVMPGRESGSAAAECGETGGGDVAQMTAGRSDLGR